MEVDQQTPSEPLLSPSGTPPVGAEGGVAGAGGTSTAPRRPGSTGGASASQAGGATAGRSSPSDDTRFDCFVCLEPVQEPVVTLCGHLFW